MTRATRGNIIAGIGIAILFALTIAAARSATPPVDAPEQWMPIIVLRNSVTGAFVDSVPYRTFETGEPTIFPSDKACEEFITTDPVFLNMIADIVDDAERDRPPRDVFALCSLEIN